MPVPQAERHSIPFLDNSTCNGFYYKHLGPSSLSKLSRQCHEAGAKRGGCVASILLANNIKRSRETMGQCDFMSMKYVVLRFCFVDDKDFD